MLTLKNTKNIKISIVILVLSLIIFAVPAAAKRAREGNTQSLRDAPQSQQSAERPAGDGISQPVNAGEAHSRIARLANIIKPQAGLPSSESQNQRSFERTDRAAVRESHRSKPNISTTRSPELNFNSSDNVQRTPDTGRRARTPRDTGGDVRVPRDTSGDARAPRDTGGDVRVPRDTGGDARSSRDADRGNRGSFDVGRRQRGSSVADVSVRPNHYGDRLEDITRQRDQSRHIFARGNPGRPFVNYQPEHHRRIYDSVIWPSYRHIVYYSRGPHFTFRYAHPYYHRKYIFVSLGGYWPLDYSYMRYFWYGCHPYYWYGYEPATYVVEGNTYNYYTYNYSGETGTVQTASGIRPVDENTFADVREKLAAQAAEKPADQTPADIYFEDAVKAFESGNYDTAAEKFSAAMDQSPEDVVLPFAYAQALFANQDYYKAAAVLKKALVKLTPDKEGVFYPRGLYADDNVLFEQIGHLAGKADGYPSDAELQFLLGYQLLGAGKLDEAIGPLQQACQNPENSDSANKLMDLLEKIKADTNNSKSEIPSNQ